MIYCRSNFIKKLINLIFLKLGFIPCKAEEPPQGMEFEGKKEIQGKQGSCLERT